MNYIKYSTEENFKHWEIMKRAKLGDKAFLEKYINTLPRFDMNLKVLFSFVCVVLFVNVIVFAVKENYVKMAMWIFMTLFYALLTYILCFVRADLHKKRIAEWKKELEELNKNALCASVPPCDKT